MTPMRNALPIIAVVLAGLCAGCPNQDRNRSIEKANAGHKAYSSGQFDVAVEAYGEAVKAYPANYDAWYSMGQAHQKRGRWKEAADAFGKAVERSPDDPMYQMWAGIALYRSALQQAAEEQAKKEDKKPEEVVVD